jgi:hypothetical protein
MGMLLLGAGGSTAAAPAGMTIRQITPLVTGNTVDTSRTLTFPSAILATGCIIVCAALGAEGSSGAADSNSIITSITMSGTGAWTRAHGRPMSSGFYGTDVWRSNASGAGATAITVNHLNDIHCSMFAIELTAPGTLATPVGSENYSDTSPLTGTVSGIPASNGIAILTVYNDPWGHPATPVFTAPSGYTKQVEYTTIDTVVPVFCVFTKLTTGSATESAEYTMTNPSAYGQVGSLIVLTL